VWFAIFGRTGRFFIYTKQRIMALKKEKKVELVSSFTDAVKGAQSIVFVAFKKLTVKDSNKLRRELQKENVLYKVTKKTLLKRALDTQHIEGDMPQLDGEIAIAYAEDLLAPARGVQAFAKDHKENLQIVGGVFEGKYMNAEKMLQIANIPPREVLLSQIAYLLKSPLQRLAIAVSEVAKTK
jgi:large subunit ribosomal protein L10